MDLMIVPHGLVSLAVRDVERQLRPLVGLAVSEDLTWTLPRQGRSDRRGHLLRQFVEPNFARHDSGVDIGDLRY